MFLKTEERSEKYYADTWPVISEPLTVSSYWLSALYPLVETQAHKGGDAYESLKVVFYWEYKIQSKEASMPAWKRYALIGIIIVAGLLFLGSKIPGCTQRSNPTLTTPDTHVEVDQSSCLFNCQTDIIVAEEGANVYSNEQSSVFGDTENQQGEALNDQESTFGGNRASLNSGDGTSQNYQDGQDISNEQDSSANEGNPPLLGTIPGWLVALIAAVLFLIAWFGFIKPWRDSRQFYPKEYL